MLEEYPLLTSEAPQSQDELEKLLPLRDLLTREVLVSSVDYALLALVDVFPHPAALIPVHTYRNRRPRTRFSNYRDCDLEWGLYHALLLTVNGLFRCEMGVCDGH